MVGEPTGGEQLFKLEIKTVLVTLKKFFCERLFPVSPVASSTPAHASFQGRSGPWSPAKRHSPPPEWR